VTPADLAAIRARLAAATPGPWRLQTCACGAVCDDAAAVKAGGVLVVECADDPDADLIAHAPTDLAALLDEVERLRAGLAAVEALIAHSDGVTPVDLNLAPAEVATYTEIARRDGDIMAVKAYREATLAPLRVAYDRLGRAGVITPRVWGGRCG